MIQFIENRKEPSSEQIQSRQNFEAVLKAYEKSNQIHLKNNWGIYFFGTVGFASVLGVIIAIL